MLRAFIVIVLVVGATIPSFASPEESKVPDKRKRSALELKALHYDEHGNVVFGQQEGPTPSTKAVARDVFSARLANVVDVDATGVVRVRSSAIAGTALLSGLRPPTYSNLFGPECTFECVQMNQCASSSSGPYTTREQFLAVELAQTPETEQEGGDICQELDRLLRAAASERETLRVGAIRERAAGPLQLSQPDPLPIPRAGQVGPAKPAAPRHDGNECAKKGPGWTTLFDGRCCYSGGATDYCVR